MIHGVSKHTANAVAALDYFLGDAYYERESKEWKPREPAPELLEGDPMQMRTLCDSLPYKHKYVSGVLSFTKEETAHIDSTPGMKEALIEELREFVYSGFKNDDAKAMVVVQHSHLDRLELHYMVPRVNLESGLSFTPFPVKYKDTPPGSANLFIEHNNAFVDHVCEKYGLQNPRDPSVKRSIELPTFEMPSATRDIRREVVKAINDLVDCGNIKSRDDMMGFLKSHGAEIPRQGKDYFSFKFPEMAKAIRLKGDLYGEQSFDTIKEHFDQRTKDFEASRESAGARYAVVNDKRSEEIETRHGKRRDEAERASAIDPGSEIEFREAEKTLDEKPDSLSNDVRDAAADAISHHPGLMEAVSMVSGSGGHSSGGAGGSTDAIADTSSGKTGNPVLDEMIAAFHSWLKAQAKKRAAAASAAFPAGPKSPTAKKSILDFVRAFTQQVAFKASVITGFNLVEPGRGQLSLHDMKDYQSVFPEQLRQSQDDLKEVERLHCADNCVKAPEPLTAPEVVKKMPSSGLPTSTQSLKDLASKWRDEKKVRDKEKGYRRGGSDFEM